MSVKCLVNTTDIRVASESAGRVQPHVAMVMPPTSMQWRRTLARYTKAVNAIISIFISEKKGRLYMLGNVFIAILTSI